MTHTCTGDDCPTCQRRTDERDNPPPPLEHEWRRAQDDYETWMWRES